MDQGKPKKRKQNRIGRVYKRNKKQASDKQLENINETHNTEIIDPILSQDSDNHNENKKKTKDSVEKQPYHINRDPQSSYHSQLQSLEQKVIILSVVLKVNIQDTEGHKKAKRREKNIRHQTKEKRL